MKGRKVLIDKVELKRMRQSNSRFRYGAKKRNVKESHRIGEIKFLRMQLNNLKKRIDYILKSAKTRR